MPRHRAHFGKCPEKQLSFDERAALIVALASLKRIPPRRLLETADSLGVHERSVQRLVKRFRDAGGSWEALVPRSSDGGRGKGRLRPEVESILKHCLREWGPLGHEALATEVRRQCSARGLQPPSRSTIRRRLQCLPVVNSSCEEKDIPQ